MALLKYGFQQGFIYLFQNEEFSNLYLVFEDDETSDWYDRFTRQGRYNFENLPEDAKSKGIDFGYPILKIKRPVRIEVDNTPNFRRQFMAYLKEHYFIEHIKDKVNHLQHWGWYKFEGVLELDKWLNDFYYFHNQRQVELQKASGIGVQMSLF